MQAKTKKHSFVVFFCLCFFIPFCVKSQVPSQRLEDIKKKIKTSKDSSLVTQLLNIADSYKYSRPDSAILYALDALTFADGIGFKKGANRAIELVGNIYTLDKEFGTSKERSIVSERIAEELIAEGNLSKVLYSLGEDYYFAYQKKNSVKWFAEASRIAGIQHRPKIQILSLCREAEIRSEIGEIQASMDRFKKAHELAVDLGDKSILADLYASMGAIDLQNEHCEDGLNHYFSSLMNRQSNDHLGQLVSLTGIIECYLKKGDIQAATANLNKALLIEPKVVDLRARTKLRLQQAMCYEKTSPTRSLEEYKKYVLMNDSVFFIHNKMCICKVRFDINCMQQQKEVKAIKELVLAEQIKRRTFLIVAIVIGFAVTFFILSVKRRNKALKIENENSKERMQLEQEKLKNIEERNILQVQKEENLRILAEIEKTRLTQELELAEIEQQKLKFELDENHRSLLTNSMQKEHFNDFLGALSDEIQQVRTQTDKKQVHQTIDQILQTIKSRMGDTEDWERIKLYFEKVHPDFFEKLKADHPNLTVNELKFCAYTKMNLNGKEMGRLLNISPSSVMVSRYRIKRKMELPEKVNFTDYILTNY